MKKYLTLIISILFFNLGYGQGIEFSHGTWSEALALAKKENKLIFVDAYAKWCGPCLNMAANTFTKKQVGDFFNPQFINMKIDMEHEDNVDFAIKYPVKGYPTLYFIDGDGKIVIQSIGAKQLNPLIALGKKALLANNKSEDYAILYENGERSYDFIIKYIKELNAAKKPSLKIANDYIKSKPELSNSEFTNIIFESMTEVDSKLFDKFKKIKKDIISILGKEAYQNKVLKACNKTLHKAIEYEAIDLVKTAVNACKSEFKSKYKTFKITAYKKYYFETHDLLSYTKSVKKYYKKIAKKDSEALLSLVNEMFQRYFRDEKINKLGGEYLNQLLILDNSIENLLFTSMYFYNNKNKAKAIEYAEKAKEKAVEQKKSTRQIFEYLKLFNKK